MPVGRRHGGDVNLPQVHSNNRSRRQRKAAALRRCRASGRVQSGPPARAPPPGAHWHEWYSAGSGSTQRRALPARGQAQQSVGQDLRAPDPSTPLSDSLWSGGGTASGCVHSRSVPAAAVRWRCPRWRRASGRAPARSGSARHTAHPWSPARAPLRSATLPTLPARAWAWSVTRSVQRRPASARSA